MCRPAGGIRQTHYRRYAQYRPGHLHGNRQTSDGAPPCAAVGDPTFKAYYHGPYPLDPGRNRHDYNGRNVLLVTDVVASGALCADLAEAVESQGGVVSGVLALIATKDAAQKSARTTVSLRNRTVPLFSLCDFPVTVLGPNEVDPAEIEEISPETILRRLIADPEN